MHRLACLLLVIATALFAWDANEDLLNAARKGDLDTVKALIEKGAPIEAKTSYGQTPLYLAAMSGHEAVVQFLLDKGAQTDVTDTFYKASMLDFVLQRKHYAVAKLIIVKGAGNADKQLKDVADDGQADLVQAVLEKGKPSQPALDSAYEAALADNKKDVAELLKKAGAHEPAPPVVVDAKVLESYAGTFKTDAIPLDIKVFVKEGKLYLQATGQSEFAPKPKSPTVFAMAAYNLEVEFDSPNTFTLKQGGQTFKFKKAVTQ
jgi:ankyrin repeat protein